MKKWILMVGFWLIAAIPVQAGDKFYARHEVNYTFDALGKSQVEQNIFLTNKLSNYYVSAYQILLQGDPINTISGRDSQGPLKITIEHPSPDQTVAKIAFNDQIVGKDKTLNFTLNYPGRPAAHNGQVWEVSLPKVGEGGEIDEYNLHLSVPPSFGQLAFISPTPASTTERRYNFTLDQVRQVGAVAAFGNFQAFDFTLSYELNNPNAQTAIAEIAIPPDTGYQRLIYSSIDPQPDNMTVDTDGNWLATFTVPPRQKITVTAIGQAHLLAEPTQTRPGLSLTQKQQYLQPTSYWPSADPQMVELARKLGTAEAIYNYVMNTLKYDQTRVRPGVERKGGLAALQTPSTSVCTEFTDLFITLARAAGIPAREINGYAYTTNQELRPLSLGSVFHAWPQYWNEKRQAWVSIDPTWGNTTGGVDYFNKLDFNHFAFVTHGVSDSTPTLAISSADVKYGVYKEFPPNSLSISWTAPWQIWPLMTNKSKVTIANPLGLAMYRIPLTIRTLNIVSRFAGPSEIDVLLPYAKRQFDLDIQAPLWPNFTAKKVTLLVASEAKTYNIEAKLFLAWQI
ncbi:MAG: transglutaminase domain-containing protein, partial [bacterium]|nr:transglutaminase domain-containing protein [bacterium]